MMRIWPFTRKPEALPHIVFSRSKAAARKLMSSDQDKTAKLVSELSAAGKHVPEYFRRPRKIAGRVE